MPIEKVSIHPALGIARVGDSPSEYYVGPEKPHEKPSPPGGFKDANGRVKRQAARFRLFGEESDGSVTELTDANANITWKVKLGNRKPATRQQPGNDSQLSITPNEQTVSGTNQQSAFGAAQVTFPAGGAYPSTDTAQVSLGEVRTDGDGHLLVLGGHGDSGSPSDARITGSFNNWRWYDDVSDGYVKADVSIPGRSGPPLSVQGAWVVVGPPKFAPELDHVITLYDRLFDLMVQWGHESKPSTVSYTDHVYPVLDRADQAKWVTSKKFGDPTATLTTTHSGSLSTGGSWNHAVTDQGAREYIFGRLKNPNNITGPCNLSLGSQDMPELKALGTSEARLTDTQLELLAEWACGNFTDDWTGQPSVPGSVTREGMDRAALENGMGAAFYPGIEVGGFDQERPIIEQSNYVSSSEFQSSFRLDHDTVDPGDITKYLAVPWQTDFYACSYRWWPVHRPNAVLPKGSSSRELWDRHVDGKDSMVCRWTDLGFVVEDGGQYVEVDREAIPDFSKPTNRIDFGTVPQGPMGQSREVARAFTVDVTSTGSQVTIQVESGPSSSALRVVPGTPDVGPTSASDTETARLWVVYETQSTGDTVDETIRIGVKNGCETWRVPVKAETVDRKEAATALVLDRSGSMDEDRGDGTSKHASLEKAASVFVDVMLENDGVGIVRYNQDAQEIQGVTKLGPAGSNFPQARSQTKSTVTSNQLDPDGRTSIGDGIEEGRSTLSGENYQIKSLVVLTDGKENEPKAISDVTGHIDEHTYAVGLGKPENTSAPALRDIANNNEGYLLVTGAVDPETRFVLRKYFLEILSDVSNADIVTDPRGTLTPGDEHRIPFQVTDADTALDVILVTDQPEAVDFRLESPAGNTIEPWRADVDPDMRWVLSDGVTYYRLAVPAEVMENRPERRGKWTAVLSLGRPQIEPDPEDEERFAELRERTEAEWVHPAEREGTPDLEGEVEADELSYDLTVQTYSNLTMDAGVQETGYVPGDELRATATLRESGIPVETASVRAHVTRPDDTTERVDLHDRGEGRFEARIDTPVAGVYRVLIRASGRTRNSVPFEREQAATGAVWHGGDRDAEASLSGESVEPDRDRLVCEAITCLAEEAVDDDRLRELGVDVEELRACARAYCDEAVTTPTDGETIDRERERPADVIDSADDIVDRFRRVVDDVL